jgi:hypothetical protein
MNRRYCLVFGVLALASCSSTDVPVVAGAGASAVAGAGGSPAAGSANIAAGAAGLFNAAGAAGTVAAGAGAGGSSGASGASSGAGGASGASSGAGGASGASDGAGGASGASGGAGGSAGKGGSGGNSGGAGAPAKYCDGKTLLPAPVIVSNYFDHNDDNSATGKDISDQLTEWVVPDNCDDPAEDNAVGSCYEFEYTPETDGGAVKWAWLTDPSDTPGYKYALVCMAAGMTKVMFRARGYVGGEKVTFGASQATPVDVTLTNVWTQYSISLTNVKYNSDSQGVQPGFYWTLVETLNPGKASVRFDIDDIKYVND